MTATSAPAAVQQQLVSKRLQLESNTVATQFVQQYYHVLSNWPENLHRFYTDASTLSHSVAGEETIRIHSQRGIHEKVMSLSLKGAVPEILSVDSQNSLGGGVVIHTTGYLTLKEKKPRLFAQVFFLAQQEKGYYVLNDLFCWVQKEGQKLQSEKGGPVEAARKDVGEVPTSVKENETKQSELPKETAASAENISEANSQGKEIEAEEDFMVDIDPNVPMTYAQRLKMAAAKPDGRIESNNKATTEAPSAGPALEETEQQGIEVATEEVDACSIFVRNLPQSISDETLLEEFSKFGIIEGGLKGISIKKVQKSNPYAFIRFESSQVAVSAIGSKVEMEGKTLEIAEKKPSIINRSKNRASNVGGKGRGDSGSGRGGSFAGGRGRGGQNGGGEGRGNGKSSGRQRPESASTQRRGRGNSGKNS